MNEQKTIGRSPNYYVRKRLQQNKPAMFGLYFIVFSCLVGLLGYLIMPDNTPSANDGAIQIQKKLPGFEARFLLLRKDYEVSKENILQEAINGQESPYVRIPVTEYWTSNDTVYYREYGRSNEIRHIDLVPAVFSLYVGETSLLGNGRNYMINNGEVSYVDFYGQLQKISLEQVRRLFEENNIQKKKFLLGTDRAGRDLLSRLMFGTRISLSIGFTAVIISLILGMTLGALAGFFGGKTDHFILWFMSVVWSIPGIMLVIAISIALQSRGIWVAFIAVGLTMWVEVARVVRGQIMSIREKTFIEATRALGMRNFRIVYAHIFPNIIGPVIVIATANFATAILLEAGLSFLGLSVQPPTPSWGNMIYEGFIMLGTKNSWHMVVFPGLAISLIVLSFNLLGNGLRDAIDPKTVLK
jgi:ABC-type dipeptide/oligopeptide/nickel transport system permease subunit